MREYKISEGQLLRLLTDSITLQFLECGGVDNWHYYGDSINDGLNIFRDEHPELPFVQDEDFDVSDIAKYDLTQYYEVIS